MVGSKLFFVLPYIILSKPYTKIDNNIFLKNSIKTKRKETLKEKSEK